MKTLTLAGLLSLSILAGCASYDGRGLKPGESSREDVLRLMGNPARQWTETGGASQLAYPRGPQGMHTYMVRIAADGKLESIENVLTPAHFARVTQGMAPRQVLRLIGPSDPSKVASYFPARDELVWEWLYCDQWSQRARFYVLFDGAARVVRSTMSFPDPECTGGEADSCWCAH